MKNRYKGKNIRVRRLKNMIFLSMLIGLCMISHNYVIKDTAEIRQIKTIIK
jgi:hypothetical protein